jgi:uncharacterized cupin superfamily protein
MKITRSRDQEWTTVIDRGKFMSRRKGLAGEKLRSSLYELPPGKRSFPFHAHHVAEEALFVLSGTAKVRTPDGEHAIGPGDHVSFPAGGPPHQLINEGSEPLVYLGMSANTAGADIVEYPDSGKVASVVGTPPNAKRFIFRAGTQVDYWDGEDT